MDTDGAVLLAYKQQEVLFFPTSVFSFICSITLQH